MYPTEKADSLLDRLSFFVKTSKRKSLAVPPGSKGQASMKRKTFKKTKYRADRD